MLERSLQGLVDAENTATGLGEEIDGLESEREARCAEGEESMEAGGRHVQQHAGRLTRGRGRLEALHERQHVEIAVTLGSVTAHHPGLLGLAFQASGCAAHSGRAAETLRVQRETGAAVRPGEPPPIFAVFKSQEEAVVEAKEVAQHEREEQRLRMTAQLGKVTAEAQAHVAQAELKARDQRLQPYVPRLQPDVPRLQPEVTRRQPYVPRLQPCASRCATRGARLVHCSCSLRRQTSARRRCAPR